MKYTIYKTDGSFFFEKDVDGRRYKTETDRKGYAVVAAYNDGIRDFEDADLRGATLRGADLHEANLSGANLRGADLSGSDLHDADLHDANLYDADLRGADLHDANLDYSCWSLSCRTLSAKIDDRIFSQLLFHAYKAGLDSENVSEELKNLAREKPVEAANKFHRAVECGSIK